jgi:hypothetical protein
MDKYSVASATGNSLSPVQFLPISPHTPTQITCFIDVFNKVLCCYHDRRWGRSAPEGFWANNHHQAEHGRRGTLAAAWNEAVSHASEKQLGRNGNEKAAGFSYW